MTTRIGRNTVLACMCVALVLAASPVSAQDVELAAPIPDVVPPTAPPLKSAAPVSLLRAVPSFKGLFREAAGDFRKLATRDAARWLTIGTAAALVARTEDSSVGTMLARPQLKQTFGSGQLIGSAPFQFGGALTVYAIGRLAGSPRAAHVGADLFRAQTVAQLTTYAMKYSIRRTRPDGTRFSFPSGHTAVTFASAAVLQRHFGWKAGIPAYGVAAFVAGSRLQTRRHHLSDVAFGAALGILAGRSITIGRGAARMAVAPAAGANGVGVSFALVGRK